MRALDPDTGHAARRCASSRSRAPTRSRSRANTACRSRTRPRSRTRSTRTCGDARSRPACSRIRGTRRPRTRIAWTVAAGVRTARSRGDRRNVRRAASRSIDAVSRRAMVARAQRARRPHGVGRIDLIEDRVVGLKSREVYECPAAVDADRGANRALERLVLTRDELRFKALVDQRYAELIYDGLWMQPLRTALDAFNATFAARMTGEVRLRLYRGTRAGRAELRSPHSALSRTAGDLRNARMRSTTRGRRVHRAAGAAARSRRARCVDAEADRTVA